MIDTKTTGIVRIQHDALKAALYAAHFLATSGPDITRKDFGFIASRLRKYAPGGQDAHYDIGVALLEDAVDKLTAIHSKYAGIPMRVKVEAFVIRQLLWSGCATDKRVE